MAAAHHGHAEVGCYPRKTADTSAAVGIDGAAPIRCTQIDAADIGVNQRVVNRFSAGELRGDRADKAIAGAGGIDRSDGAARNDQWFAVDQRQHAALAQRHADDFVFAGLQGSRSLDKSRMIVAVAKLGLCQKAEFAFIEDENIDEIEQFALRIRVRAPD